MIQSIKCFNLDLDNSHLLEILIKEVLKERIRAEKNEKVPKSCERKSFSRIEKNGIRDEKNKQKN